MRIIEIEKCKDLLIYYKDYKYANHFMILQEDPLILVDEDGYNYFYPESIEEMVEWDKNQGDLEFDHYEIDDNIKMYDI